MSKIFEWILYGILIVLFFSGVAFSGSIIRSHPLIPITLLLLSLTLGFLFSKVPGFFGDNTLYSVLKYTFYFSLVATFLCFVFYSKGKAYAEKFIFEGKVKNYEAEIDTDEGEGYTTEYYLENLSSSKENIIEFVYWALMIGTPYLIYKMWQKTPAPPNK